MVGWGLEEWSLKFEVVRNLNICSPKSARGLGAAELVSVEEMKGVEGGIREFLLCTIKLVSLCLFK